MYPASERQQHTRAKPALPIWRLFVVCVFFIGLFSEQSRAQNADGVYQDKVIAPADLPAQDDDSGNDKGYNPQGWPRSLQIELRLGQVAGDKQDLPERGLRVNGSIDTPQYGALSLDAIARSPTKGSNLWTLWQRAMPFDNGWEANNAIGAVNSLSTDLMRNTQRFAVPGFALRGLTTQWLNRSLSLDTQLSIGKPGRYDGYQLSGFVPQQGTVLGAGLQWGRVGEQAVALQLARSQNILASEAGQAATSINDTASGTSLWASGQYKLPNWLPNGQSVLLQGNLLVSQLRIDAAAAPTSRRSIGAWLDGAMDDGPYAHRFGVFRFDKDLSWAHTPILSDVQGAYWRSNYRAQQWIWDANAELLNSVSGANPSGGFVSASARYQWYRSLALSGGVSLRQFAGNGVGMFAGVEQTTRFGQTRAQLDIAKQTNDDRAEELKLEQAWNMPLALRLSTSLLLGANHPKQSRAYRYAGGAFALGGDLSPRLSLDLNANARRNIGNSVGSNSDYNATINLAANWQLNQQFTLSAVYSQTTGSAVNDIGNLDPLTGIAPQQLKTNSRVWWLLLRYQEAAGSALIPLGGKAGGGFGAVSGVVFLDANEDGQMQSQEKGAGNVTVLLDGRYAVRTDAQGRFEFTAAASGRHNITVVPDNLPLPWTVVSSTTFEVDVPTRGKAVLFIPATKIK